MKIKLKTKTREKYSQFLRGLSNTYVGHKVADTDLEWDYADIFITGMGKRLRVSTNKADVITDVELLSEGKNEAVNGLHVKDLRSALRDQEALLKRNFEYSSRINSALVDAVEKASTILDDNGIACDTIDVMFVTAAPDVPCAFINVPDAKAADPQMRSHISKAFADEWSASGDSRVGAEVRDWSGRPGMDQFCVVRVFPKI